MFSHPRDIIEVPAIVEPHQGISYNPPAEAHNELLGKALEVELKRVKDAEKLAEVKAKIESAMRVPEAMDISLPAGMKVDEVGLEDEQDVDEEQQEAIPRKKMPERKTKAQRNKAAKLLKEVCYSRCSISWVFFIDLLIAVLETNSGRTGNYETDACDDR